MRLFYILIFLLLAQVSQAQSAFRKVDFYTLTTDPTIRHYASLKLHGTRELVIRETGSDKLKLTPREVAAFRIGTRSFLTVENSELDSGYSDDRVSLAFAEVLDSGKVSLLRYEGSQNVIMPTLSLGVLSPRVGSVKTQLYMLRDALTENNSTIPADGLMGGGPRFRSALLPFLTNRADLLKLLTENRLNIEDLPDVVRAINSGNSFHRTPKVPFGVD